MRLGLKRACVRGTMPTLVVAAGLSIVAGGVSVAAEAKPVYKSAPALVAPGYNWAGLYMGIFTGYGWGEHTRHIDTLGFSNSYDSSGGLIGGLVGFNWQFFPSWVLGVEGDVAWTNVRGDDGRVGGTLDETLFNWVNTARGRIGFAWNNVLIFGTAGAAYADLRHTNDRPPIDQFSNNNFGWAIGGGIEYAFPSNWSARIEYRYYDFGSYTRSAPANGVRPYSVDNTLQTVTVGMSYHFTRGSIVTKD